MRHTAPPSPTLPAGQPEPRFEPASPLIECHPDVLETVRAAAVDGLMRLGRGGIEVGGLLFGRNTGDAVRILAVRPFECEHRFGPGFVLSENDEALLRQSIDPDNRDEETRDLDLVGWYMSHCRRGCTLAESDVLIFDRYFPKPGSVTLVVIPERSGPARAGFFVRDANGAVRPDVPYSEVSLAPAAEPIRAVQRSLAVVDNAEDSREVALTRLQTYLKGQEKHRRVSTLNLWITLALFLLPLIGGGCYLWIKGHAIGGPAAIPLNVSGSGTQIRIEWDAKLESVQKASAGLLEMREADGTSVRVNVPPDALRTGSAIYNRRSEKVEIRLRLLYPNRPPFDSVVYFINPLSSEPARSPEPSAKPPEAPPTVAGKTDPPPRVPGPQPETAKSPDARRFEPPKIAGSTPAPVTTVELGPATLPTDVSPSGPAPSLKLPLSSAPVAPPPAPAPPRAPARPHSGRLIWTGELARNALLSFSATGVSAGSMNGHLPGYPVSVAVYPGDLVAGGIEVYVRDPNRATTAEPPGAQNGWNTTVFKYDPKRIPDIRILEAPTAANSWNQLVLQNGKRPISVLVIDWAESR